MLFRSRCMDALTKDHSNQCYIFNDYKTTLQIPYNEIICFTSLKHSVDILTTKDIFKQRSTLNTIAGYLPDCFIRCHRSNIVNMKHIYKIEGTTISLSNHLTLQIGRSYLNDVRKAFMAFAVRMRYCYFFSEPAFTHSYTVLHTIHNIFHAFAKVLHAFRLQRYRHR